VTDGRGARSVPSTRFGSTRWSIDAAIVGSVDAHFEISEACADTTDTSTLRATSPDLVGGGLRTAVMAGRPGRGRAPLASARRPGAGGAGACL